MRYKPRTVFLSSTARDLTYHRTAVFQAIEQLEGWRCDAMEKWPASINTPADEIQRRIARSDLFVGLVGHIHGSISPGPGNEKSYIELEYDFAIELGKPCLMFVAKDTFTIPAELRENDNDHAMQRRFRVKVHEQHVKEFDDPHQLATQVILSIVNWREQPVFRSNRSDLVQVPSPPIHFFGRISETLNTLHHLNNGANILLYGPSGVGKTALAAKISTQLRKARLRCQDGHLYFDLRSYLGSDTISFADRIKEHVIHYFYPQAKFTTADRAMSLYRRALAKKSILLVVDNVTHITQVEAFVTAFPKDSSLIIISERNLQVFGTIRQELGPLSQNEARQCLSVFCGQARLSEHDLDAIGNRVGRLPAKLREAAKYFDENSTLSARDYLRQLDDDEEASLRQQLNALQLSEPILVERWELLSVFPTSFDAASAATIWELFEHEALYTLNKLYDQQLVILDRNSGRYNMHSLKRSYARALLQAKQDSENAALRLHACHYRKLLEKLNEKYICGGKEALLDALHVFDNEWPNIESGHNWATKKWRDEEVAACLCKEYPLAGADLLSLRRSAAERRKWLEAGLSVAQDQEDWSAAARLLDQIGVACRESGEPKKAIDSHNEALKLAWDHAADPRLEARILTNLGRAHWELGEAVEAIQHFEAALTIAEQTPDLVQQIGLLDSLGIASREYAEDTSRAIAEHEKARQFAKDIGDRRAEARAIDNLGLDYLYAGDADRAIALYKDALVIADEIGDLFEKASILQHLGSAYRDSGSLLEAERRLDQALQLSYTLGDRRIEARVRGDTGLLLQKNNELEQAINCHIKHLDIARSCGDKWGENAALYHLGIVYGMIGDRGAARDHLNQACTLADMLGDRRMKAMVLSELRRS